MDERFGRATTHSNSSSFTPRMATSSGTFRSILRQVAANRRATPSMEQRTPTGLGRSRSQPLKVSCIPDQLVPGSRKGRSSTWHAANDPPASCTRRWNACFRDTAKPERSDPANPKWRNPRSKRCSAAITPTASCLTSTMGKRGSFRVLVMLTTGPPQAAKPSASSSLNKWAMTPSGCHSLSGSRARGSDGDRCTNQRAPSATYPSTPAHTSRVCELSRFINKATRRSCIWSNSVWGRNAVMRQYRTKKKCL